MRKVIALMSMILLLIVVSAAHALSAPMMISPQPATPELNLDVAKFPVSTSLGIFGITPYRPYGLFDRKLLLVPPGYRTTPAVLKYSGGKWPTVVPLSASVINYSKSRSAKSFRVGEAIFPANNEPLDRPYTG